MKKIIKNERGYALIFALFAIILISLIGITLVNSTISTATQAKQVDSLFRATDIGEMGVEFTFAHIESQFENEPPTSLVGVDDVENYFEPVFNDIAEKVDSVVIDASFPEREFTLLPNQNGTLFTVTENVERGGFDVSYHIIGFDGNKEKDLSVKFFIPSMNNSPTNPGDSETGWDNIVPDEDSGDWITRDESGFLNGEEHDGNIKLIEPTEINQNNLSLKVNGHFIAEEGLYSTSPQSEILICGNAVFKGVVKGSIKGNGQDNFKSTMEIGNHAVFHRELQLHNRPYLSGGSTYLKGGAYIHNASNFTVGQDLILDVASQSYTFNAELNIKGNLVFKNADSSTIKRLFTAKNTVKVGGEVRIYYQGQDTYVKDGAFVISENIHEGYVFDNHDIFTPSCMLDLEPGEGSGGGAISIEDINYN